LGASHSGRDLPRTAKAVRLGPMVAVAVGVLTTLLVVRIGSAHDAEQGFANSELSTTAGSSSVASAAASAAAMDSLQLNGMKPQQQAESLLELAIGESAGAVEQISSRVDRWPGRLKWNSQIATLTTAALNSDDRRVRESGIEVELAAYGLSRNAASLDYVLKTAESSHHARKIWALWALGLLGNRGIETDRVGQVLTAHLNDSDEDSRRWAVEGLAIVGSNQTIAPLLKTMHDDPSASVRERAACGLAQSGMFTREQRLGVVPQLLRYTDDPTLDAQTHGWAFQALAEITRQRLPEDSTVWRDWYERRVASGQ
jgi:hypothetical protein